jgi:acetolactate synthase I/II/III large subunit
MGEVVTGGAAIVSSLLAEEVDTVFGIPGVQTYALFEALRQAGDRIRVIGARHEQATAYMAFGYAQSTGRPGVYTVVPGVGMLNSSAALASAYGASSPVVCLTSEIPSTLIGRGLGHLHELPDQMATLRTITKWTARIDHPAHAPAAVAQAFFQARQGRPRPVALAMPWDVLDQRALVPPAQPLSGSAPAADPNEIDRAVDLVGRAEHPMIMVGGGAEEAAPEVRELAEHLQAPVVSFRGGKGILPDDHPLALTCAAGYQLWPGTDLMIGIGSRLELSWFRWGHQPPGLRVVNIDIDPTQHVRLGVDVGVVGDARDTTAQLVAALRTAVPRHADRTEEFVQLKERVAKEIQRVTPHVPFLAAIREVLPRDGFFVEEICQAGFASYFAFPVYQPRRFITCGYQGTLGFGFPTALGVQAAHPDSPVVSITGDGGFLFGVQELATAVQYGLNLVTVVFNNNAFGNVWRDQRNRFDGHDIGSVLRNPDFVALAESFGAAGYRARTPAELRTTLDRALHSGRPAVIEVPVDRGTEASPWEFLTPHRK